MFLPSGRMLIRKCDGTIKPTFITTIMHCGLRPRELRVPFRMLLHASSYHGVLVLTVRHANSYTLLMNEV